MLPTDICNALHNGTPVVLYRPAAAGKLGGADRWQFVAVKLDNGALLVSAAGRDSWQPLAQFVAQPLRYAQRVTARIALMAQRAIEESGFDAEQSGFTWDIATRCSGSRRTRRGEQVACGEWLVHPLSIAAGAGPVCRGYYRELEQKREARRAIVQAAWMERLAPPVQVAPVQPTPQVPTCDGRCSLDTVCPTCG